MHARNWSVAFASLIALAYCSVAIAEEQEVVILYTNDFHSAIDPIPAYWMPGDPSPHLGGAAELMTLVEQIRERLGVLRALMDRPSASAIMARMDELGAWS